MSLKSIPDEERETLLMHYGLERVTRAADAHDESEEDDEEAYTEDDIAAMNSAQLNRFRHKRAIVPIILGGVLALLLICLIVGVLLVKGPGQALRGYSISASNVAPIWKNKWGGLYIYIDPDHVLWLFGRTRWNITHLPFVPIPNREYTTQIATSSALSITTYPGQPALRNSSAEWAATVEGLPQAFWSPLRPGDVCQPSAATTIQDRTFLFWKYFSANAEFSYAWGAGELIGKEHYNYSIRTTQPVTYDLKWDPEATIVVGEYVFVYFLHDSLYGDGRDELYVGRMPAKVASFGDTERFMQFWTGRAWKSSSNQASPIIDQFGNQASIIYNNYVGKYLLVDSGYSNTLRIYQSSSPYDGWGAAPASIFTDIRGNITQAYFMPGLFEDNGKTMYITYRLLRSDESPDILKVTLLAS